MKHILLIFVAGLLHVYAGVKHLHHSGVAPADDSECYMDEGCLWQTCLVGTDAGWWTVNCEVNEDDCEETIEHNCCEQQCQVSHSCRPCFNLQCPGCQESWDNGCQEVFEQQNVHSCPVDPDFGKNCGRPLISTLIVKTST